MIVLYLVIVLVVVALIALPSTRKAFGNPRALFTREGATEQARRAKDAARTAAETARGAAGTASTVAKGTTGAVRDMGASVVASHAGRQLRTLGRTLVIDASPQTLAPLLTEGMVAAAVVDPVTVAGDETQAWIYSGMGDVRFCAVPATTASGVAGTVFGVVSFEYDLGEPQGVSAAGVALEKVSRLLADQGIAFADVTRTFTPDAEDTTAGLRVADPLA